MPLEPTDERHAAQIEAGTTGRRRGHSFETLIADEINQLAMPFNREAISSGYLFRGNPGRLVLNLMLNHLGIGRTKSARAIPAGRLATAESGAKELLLNGVPVKRCKSDVIVIIDTGTHSFLKGVSVKQCSNRSPTNAQLYFSTATAFCELLRSNGISVSDRAIDAMRMFCGDRGYRPLDNKQASQTRQYDPNRWFWEELPVKERKELERTFTKHQDTITKLLLQKAYSDDPFPPDYLVHQTRCAIEGEHELAIFAIDDFVRLSRKYAGFHLRTYRIKKGSHKDPPGIQHLAPRFGVVQFQRGGQKQHPTQLQFNLKAGYFYKAPFSPVYGKPSP